ncbi:MAG: MFS transporter [SAR324 cluster bacterium]|nr:MFS transporter [SAR324 cluster bacterium]
MKSLLWAQHFKGFFWTQFLGAFNDNLFKQSIIFMASFQLASTVPKAQADFYVSLGAGIFILPFVLFSNWGASWADRKGKTKVIQATKKMEVAIMLFGAAAYFFLDQQEPMLGLWALMLVLFLMGTQSALFGPSKYGILPEIIEESQLTESNSLLEMGTFVGILLGAYGGGWLVEAFGLQPTFMALFFVGFAGLGLYSSLSIPETTPVDSKALIPWFFPAQIWADSKYMIKNKDLTATILGISYFWFAGAILLQIIPGYGVLIGASSIQTNFLLILFSLGIGVGSMFCIPLSRFSVDLGLVSIGAIGLSFFCLDFGLFPPKEIATWLDLWRVYGDLFFIGFFAGLFIVPLNAQLQWATTKSDRARMMALNNILNAFFMVFATGFTLVLRSFLGFTESQLVAVVGISTFLALVVLVGFLPLLKWQGYLWAWSLFKSIPQSPSGPCLVMLSAPNIHQATPIQAAFSQPIPLLVKDKSEFKETSLSNWRGVFEWDKDQAEGYFAAGKALEWVGTLEEAPKELVQMAQGNIYYLSEKGKNKWEFVKANLDFEAN